MAAKKKSKPIIEVELSLPPDGAQDEVGIWVGRADGKDLSAQDIIDAVAETLLLHWDSFDMTPVDNEEYDA